MDRQISSPCSQEPDAWPCPEPDQSSPKPTSLFLDPFSIVYLQRFILILRLFWTVRKICKLLGVELLAPRPTPKSEDHYLSPTAYTVYSQPRSIFEVHNIKNRVDNWKSVGWSKMIQLYHFVVGLLLEIK